MFLKRKAQKICKESFVQVCGFWEEKFSEHNRQFIPPELVVFNGDVTAPSGHVITSEAGPRFHSVDRQIYIPVKFYKSMKPHFMNSGGQLSISGVFGSVIGHEVGHYVQQVLETPEHVAIHVAAREETLLASQIISYEREADHLSGLFAHHAYLRGYMKQQDLKSALCFIQTCGDNSDRDGDELLTENSEYPHPSSKQRVASFNMGFRRGCATALFS